MTQEEKQLLLTDLCARLPYGVCVHIKYKIGGPCDGKFTSKDLQWLIDSKVETIKPYLRSLSTMTEEEKNIFQSLQKYFYGERYIGNNEWENTGKVYYDTVESLDWLNKNHFDYRGLISMGLALEAPEGMYKNE